MLHAAHGRALNDAPASTKTPTQKEESNEALMPGIGMLRVVRRAGDDFVPRRPYRPTAEIRRILVERIDVQKQGIGIVVGVGRLAGRHIVAVWPAEKDDKRPLNGEHTFRDRFDHERSSLRSWRYAERGELEAR